jgi:hypothetical protein
MAELTQPVNNMKFVGACHHNTAKHNFARCDAVIAWRGTTLNAQSPRLQKAANLSNTACEAYSAGFYQPNCRVATERQHCKRSLSIVNVIRTPCTGSR